MAYLNKTKTINKFDTNRRYVNKMCQNNNKTNIVLQINRFYYPSFSVPQQLKYPADVQDYNNFSP